MLCEERLTCGQGNIVQPEDFRDDEDEKLEGYYDPYADPTSNADASTP